MEERGFRFDISYTNEKIVSFDSKLLPELLEGPRSVGLEEEVFAAVSRSRRTPVPVMPNSLADLNINERLR